jgi:hypothetical protein
MGDVTVDVGDVLLYISVQRGTKSRNKEANPAIMLRDSWFIAGPIDDWVRASDEGDTELARDLVFP